MSNKNISSVFAKASTFSLASVLVIGALIAPIPTAAANSALNDTAEPYDPKKVGTQSFTVASDVVVQPLERGSYTVVDLAEERRQAALATLDSQASFLQVTTKSFVIHDKNDGSVIYPITTWHFEPGSNGYHTSERPDHNGVDFPIDFGADIYAVAAGTVKTVSFDEGGYGNYMVLSHEIGGYKVETLYGHMDKLPEFSEGQTVKKGQIIGPVGSTGRSTGPHLHFEVTVNGVGQDPASWLELNALR